MSTNQLNVILSKKEAFLFVEQNEKCNDAGNFDLEHFEEKMKLRPDYQAKNEFGYAWRFWGEKGSCLIDAETGETEYGMHAVLVAD